MNKKTSFLFGIFVIVVIFLFFIAVVYAYYENKKELDCLKPYATNFCFEQNTTYVEHNIRYFSCNNTLYNPRFLFSSGTLDSYYFIPEELKACGIGI
jgi:hypothetical protein